MDMESLDFLRGLNVPIKSVRRQVGMLSGGQRQLVAIARALMLGARVILLDEPTAALGVRETGRVTGMIEMLRERKCAVILVSHDMNLVFRVADRVQVMRLGAVAGVRETQQTTKDEVIALLTGSRGEEPPA
jgi:ABC-type sugar transport system ATPase subunit